MSKLTAALVAVFFPSGHATRLKLAAEARAARATKATESLKTIVGEAKVVRLEE